MSITITELQLINTQRCESEFRKIDDWDLPKYGNAIAGEVGELCNILKKIDSPILPAHHNIGAEEAGKELADILCYACLIATRLNLNLEDCVREKFNEVSDRVGSPIKLS